MKARVAAACLLWGLVVGLFPPAEAQVVLDGTIGTSGEKSLPGPNYVIRESYGHRTGDNLFHSLKTLNIEAHEVADFSASSSVQHIIARITGGASRIDGTLQSTLTRSGLLSNADLFLLNPAGVVFGPNARLDLGGSFHLSTADYLRLGEAERFYSRPVEGEVLSSAPPQAFGFLTEEPSPITLEGGSTDAAGPGLAVKKGEAISLIGGDIAIGGITADGEPADRVAAPEGRIGITGTASAGEIGLPGPGIPPPAASGDVSITGGAVLSTSGAGSGDIYIRGGTFLLKNSTLLADNFGDADGGVVDITADTIRVDGGQIFSDNQNPDVAGEEVQTGAGNGGDIRLSAREAIEITRLSSIFADSHFQGDADREGGRAGSITLSAERITVGSGSTVSSDTYGTGEGGRLTLTGGESVVLEDDARIFSGALGKTGSAGDGGDILIQSPRITMLREAKINTDTRNGGGRGGDVRMGGPDGTLAAAISVTDSQIFAGAVNGQGEAAGSGGTVELAALEIAFTDGARIGSESLGAGRGGNVTLRAPGGTIRFSGADAGGESSRVLTTAESESPDAGDAGDITLSAGEIHFDRGGGVTASTLGPGDAGTIDITADHLFITDGGRITSSSDHTGAGGAAGAIGVTLSEVLSLEDSGSIISTETAGQGPGGDITVAAGSISIRESAAISSASRNAGAAGDAGTLSLTAKGGITVTEKGAVTTEALNAGGGRMVIDSGGMLRVDDGRITTSVQQGAGNGGDIDAAARFIVLDNGQVIAKAFEGRGGNIRIVADQFIASPDSLVSASSELGIDGDIFIESPVTDISSILAVLPDQFLDAGQWIVKSCAEQAVEDASRFIVKGREGVPAPVDDWLASP